MIYCLTEHDYDKKITRVIDKFTDKTNALNELERVVFNLIQELLHHDTEIKIYDKHSRGKPFDYYLYRNSDKYTDKIKIKKKYKIAGYLYNAVGYKTLKSYYITEMKIDGNNKVEIAPFHNTVILDEVNKLSMLQEIRNKVKLSEEIELMDDIAWKKIRFS